MKQHQQSDSPVKMVQVVRVQGVHFSIKLHSGGRLRYRRFGKLSQVISTAKPPKASIKQNCQRGGRAKKMATCPTALVV